jgi:hypothetical protein
MPAIVKLPKAFHFLCDCLSHDTTMGLSLSRACLCHCTILILNKHREHHPYNSSPLFAWQYLLLFKISSLYGFPDKKINPRLNDSAGLFFTLINLDPFCIFCKPHFK